MRNPEKALDYSKYNPDSNENVRIPDLADDGAMSVLFACWDRTRDMDVPQLRDGECEVRQLWDEAVPKALGWNSDWLSELRQLLHDEPHVRGGGREQYGERRRVSGRVGSRHRVPTVILPQWHLSRTQS